jgi:phospholipid/cholesterol/gamma-HCH transport system substrate-binding protein
MKNSLETRLGVFVALTVIAAVLILEVLGGVERFQRGYRLYARFSTVQDLKVGDRVKMGGFEIGRVESIGLATNEAKVQVSMKIRKTVAVKADSVATIKFAGLMGQNFVSVEFGSKDSKSLDAEGFVETQDQPDISAVLAKINNVAGGLENITKSFTGFKLDDLMAPLTDFIKANKGPLTATIANLQAISTQVSSGQGTVGKLLYDDALYQTAYGTVTNIDQTVSEIKSAVTDAKKVIAQVNSGQGTVGKLIHDEKLYQEVTDAATSLKEILQKINQGQGSIGKLVNDDDLIKNAKLTLQKLDKATEGLEDQGPLSVLGLVAGQLF